MSLVTRDREAREIGRAFGAKEKSPGSSVIICMVDRRLNKWINGQVKCNILWVAPEDLDHLAPGYPSTHPVLCRNHVRPFFKCIMFSLTPGPLHIPLSLHGMSSLPAPFCLAQACSSITVFGIYSFLSYLTTLKYSLLHAGTIPSVLQISTPFILITAHKIGTELV